MDAFESSNPLEVIEQLTYLLFIRRLDDLHTLEENKAARTKRTMERRIFPEDKEFFYLFDYCQNLEYFSQDVPATEGWVADSLAKRLFDARLELVAAVDAGSRDGLSRIVKEPTAVYGDPRTNEELRYGPGSGQGGHVELRRRPDLVREPARVHQPRGGRPDRARCRGTGPAVRVAVHGHHSARTDGLFQSGELEALMRALEAVRATAVAA